MRSEKGSGFALYGSAMAQGLLLLMILAAGCQGQRGMVEVKTGYAALEAKQFDEAMGVAEKVLNEKSSGRSTAHAHYLKGRALEQRPKKGEAERVKELSAAKREYQAALTKSPDRNLAGYIRTSLGNVMYWLDDFAAAETEWKAAMPLLDDPQMQAWVLYRAGICQQRQGKWEQADETYAAVIRQFVGSEPASRAVSRKGARSFYVQIDAIRDKSAADGVSGKLRLHGIPSTARFDAGRKTYVVMAGPYATWQEAVGARRTMGAEFPGAVVIP